MAITGLLNSYLHVDNGMTAEDMLACRTVADRSGEVIIFRSTGSWSMRWIARKYPTKNFHVKGKSSDWGPQAGFVPYDGKYSKVGRDDVKAKDGTKANQDGIDHKYADKVQLSLDGDELKMQLNDRAGNPRKKACTDSWPIPKTDDLLLRALRSGDNAPFLFRAVKGADDKFALYVYTGKANATTVLFNLAARDAKFDAAAPGLFEPLMVMTSAEKDAKDRPMTGDYDLMAVCPPWNDYGATSKVVIEKEALDFGPGMVTHGQIFAAGSRLDAVLDMTSNTGAVGRTVKRDGKDVKVTFQNKGKSSAGSDEHKDMGNITGRILRCINALNTEMPNGASAFRRVHHNAESHRNFLFGAITGSEMIAGDGVPLTVFQPATLCRAGSPTAQFGDVATFETLSEFKQYALLLQKAGYFVPRNWTWGMSIRDQVGGRKFAALEKLHDGKGQLAVARANALRK